MVGGKAVQGVLIALGLAFLGGGSLWGRAPSEPPLPPKALSLADHRPRVADGLVQIARGLPDGAPAALSEPAARATLDGRGRMRVIIEPAAGVTPAALAAQLQARGVRIEARSRSLVRALVRPEQLEALGSWTAIHALRRPHRFQLEDAPTSQALTPLGATLLHSLAVQGQGIKVAIIDVGFGSLAFAQDQGALPPEVLADFTDYSGLGASQGNHGTSVALIVHEMAPQAQLYLKQVNDELDLENAVEDALRQGVQVVNHSVGWTNSNFSDGTGFFAELVRRAQEAGVLWVNAAGNHALNHWTGRLVDADHDRWSDFPGTTEEALRVPAYFGSLISISLTWDDWPRTAQDLDLYLYDGAGHLVASSADWQLGAEPPVEALDYFVEKTDVYRVRVLARRTFKPLRIKLFTDSSHPLKPHTPHGSLLAPADAPGALAVGAVSLFNWPDGPQELFSSLGPTSDGRIKPDLVGPDGTRNLLLNPFSGTSAAAPHVAGAAALIWSQHPGWDASQVRRALEESARDLGRPGKDVIYGAGALDLARALPWARRSLSAARVRPGQSLTVTLRARLPALTFGALALHERPPAGWTLTSNDPAYGPARGSWRWGPLGPGAEVETRYTLTVPAAQAPGQVPLRGTVDGVPIGGETTLEVLPALTPPATKLRTDGGLAVQRRQGQLAISAPGGGLTLTVFDLAGQVVYRASTNGQALRWNGLTRRGATAANGVYLVRVELAGPPRRSELFPVVWLR